MKNLKKKNKKYSSILYSLHESGLAPEGYTLKEWNFMMFEEKLKVIESLGINKNVL